MIYKPNQRFLGEQDGRPSIYPFEMHDTSFIKQAAAGGVHPDIKNYMDNAVPIPGKNILLLDALGAGEVWGPNINGDFYGRKELMREDDNAGYRSFMNFAYPYKHHQNEARKKDPSRRYGEKVVLSRYHEPMDRVQLIVIVDATPDKAQDIVQQCDDGMYPDVSMACSVAYDKCSICGSIHRTRNDYCHHASSMLNRLMPDGQKVFLYNIKPKFHDISFVTIGADRSAKVLAKVAMPIQLERYLKRSTIDKDVNLSVDNAVTKDSDENYKKLTPEELTNLFDKVSNSGGEELNKITLKQLSHYPIGDVIKTANALSVYFTPKEFQYITVNHFGNEKKAEYLYDNDIVFDENVVDDPTNHKIEGSFSHDVARQLEPELPKKSGLYPFIIPRMLNKQAGMVGKAASSVKKMVWPALGGFFSAYKKQIPSDLQKMIAGGIKQAERYAAPAAVTTALQIGSDLGRNFAKKTKDVVDNNLSIDYSSFDTDLNDYYKAASISPMMVGVGSVPIMYALSYLLDKKRKSAPMGQGISPVGDFVADNPGISSIISLLTLPKVMSSMKLDKALSQTP